MRKLFLITFLLIFATSLSAGSALASTAANAQIINNASLTFDDGTGLQTISAAVTVTVDLVAALPNLSTPPDAATVYTGTDTTLTFDYTMTSGSNGPDTYALSTLVASDTNTDGGSASAPAAITLGASVTSTDTGTTTTLEVPSDGSGADNVVNEIAAGDTIVVDLGTGPETVTVLSVTDPGGSGTATITLDTTTTPALSASAPAGTPIFEQQTFTLTVASGTITTAGSDITVTADISVTNSGLGPLTNQVVATYTSGVATLTKYVRNVTSSVIGSGAQSFTIGTYTGDYYTGGVTGAPGDVLEYVLFADNTGTAALTATEISDLVPETFVTFNTGNYDTGSGARDIYYLDTSGTADSFTIAPADDQASFIAGNNPNLSVYVGVGAGVATPGAIPINSNVTVAYQVTIK